MINLSSYNIRKRLFSIINKEWFHHIYFVGYKKVLIKKNNNMKSLGSKLENPPLEYINGWYVIRYGYEPVSDTEGVFTFVEHRFKSKPTIERIQALVENYNLETGNSLVVNTEDYI